ncbi:MAG: hypothetical protein ACR2IE_00285 [Candidatus Sumerlaeaceae bacterium]
MARETSDGSVWYFSIFLALAAAAAVVSTSELVGDAAALAQFFALLFGAFAVFTLWMERRNSPSPVHDESVVPHPACAVDERPAKRNATKFPA